MFNMFRKQKHQKPKLVETIVTAFQKMGDFLYYLNDQAIQPYWICYQTTLVDSKIIHEFVLPSLNKHSFENIEDIKKAVPIEDIIISKDIEEIKSKVISGYIMVQFHKHDQSCALIRAALNENRSISVPEVEFSVVGPKEAFVESLDTNLNLIRKRLPIIDLKVKEVTVGELSKTRISVLYIEGITDKTNVRTVLQRLKDIEFDQLVDSSFVAQMIADNQKSPFPQLLDTERPDRVASVLSEGKVVILVDGSPHALIGPTTIIEFFSSFEDYFLNWYVATFLRLLRFFSVTFSILVTPLYVAVLTFHYELIPRELMGTLITSRRVVPLPPILEAVFLELTIELLREAGARLPTKVGQTIGIVGGIVIGTAAVEAGLTSNVLLIIVALAALASFTTPVYNMGNTIRILRFPFLLFAQLWGLLGVVYCFCILLTHLIRLTSLGRPILEPIYPLRLNDLKDGLVRLPFSKLAKRPQYLRSQQPERFNRKNAQMNKDIDE
ncbi:spore germination protein [Cytobacillus sp. S13-E01]|uniref:spore germination protein n=1 Tax=Cytobacillus sp. S13-E01 TaxID=3031326 RepID=UPI0023D841FF|nr:spore germination protein [Cytobacillus sp. S13-E01]MDF0728082.1 spore germination protein [Cytobacillus sp. S13-E01]